MQFKQDKEKLIRFERELHYVETVLQNEKHENVINRETIDQ
jgi:hypothetical protein